MSDTRVNVSVHSPKIVSTTLVTDKIVVTLGSSAWVDLFFTSDELVAFAAGLAPALALVAEKNKVNVNIACSECGNPAPSDESGNPAQTLGNEPVCHACLNDYYAENGIDA